MSEVPAGFEVEVHNSCTQPILVMGATPRWLVNLWRVLAIMMIVNFHQLWWILVWAILHVGFMYWTRKDPHWLEIYLGARKLPRRFEV